MILIRVPSSALSSSGASHSETARKPSVIAAVLPACSSETSLVVAGSPSAISPVAMASTVHSTRSCSVAQPSTILAKRVSIIPRSIKILEITGIEVTATATPMTSWNASVLPALPIRKLRSNMTGAAKPSPNGSAVAATSTTRMVLRSSRDRFRWIRKPEVNSSRTSPIQYSTSSAVPCLPAASNSQP